MKNIIFYFSGTGNSAFIAKSMADNIENCKVIDLSRYTVHDALEVDRIGFVFPVYWWGIPNIVAKFINALKIKSANYVFAAVTMGSSSGNAIPLVKSLLERKNIILSAGYKYRMPDNYIIAHAAPTEDKQREIIDLTYKKLKGDIEKIIEKTETPISKEHVITKMINQHYIKTYATIDKKFCVSSECTHCGLCEKECPVGNIEIVEGIPTWKHSCESCLKCIQYCPQNAINYTTKTINRKRYRLNYESYINKLV